MKKKNKFKLKEKSSSKVSLREHSMHGKQVASDSVPISSSNIGHRMLAAMG
jgi:hypothetical protein